MQQRGQYKDDWTWVWVSPCLIMIGLHAKAKLLHNFPSIHISRTWSRSLRAQCLALVALKRSCLGAPDVYCASASRIVWELQTGSPGELTAGTDLPVCTCAKLAPEKKNIYTFHDGFWIHSLYAFTHHLSLQAWVWRSLGFALFWVLGNYYRSQCRYVAWSRRMVFTQRNLFLYPVQSSHQWGGGRLPFQAPLTIQERRSSFFFHFYLIVSIFLVHVVRFFFLILHICF